MRPPAVVTQLQSHALLRELARVTNHPLDEVRVVYERQFRDLDSQARVKTYLPIFAARRTREVLATH